MGVGRWTVKMDGGCPSNPGPGAFAFVIDKGNEKLAKFGFLPMATNNQAEYRALTAALLFLADQPDLPPVIEMWSDSEVIVRQMAGRYKVNEALRPFYEDAVFALKALKKKRNIEIALQHFKREHNGEADELCNLVLERRGIEIVSKRRIKRVAALSQS